MSLASLIRKKPLAAVATAIPAIPAISATHGLAFAGAVARIATVAVATSTEVKTDSGNSSHPGDQQAASDRWLVHFVDRDPLDVVFSPAATHDKVLAAYPTAAAVESFEAITGQAEVLISADQAAAIGGWLTQIGEGDQSIIDDVLTRCRNDEGARAYYVGRAEEVPAVADLDDRRCCTQCGNCRIGFCAIAAPAGVVSAIRGYRPAQEILRRCAGYVPKGSDKRTGRECSPDASQKGAEYVEQVG